MSVEPIGFACFLVVVGMAVVGVVKLVEWLS